MAVAESVFMGIARCMAAPFDMVRKYGERRFFRGHDHQQVIDCYNDSVDKIIVFNNLGSLVDVDARKAQEFALNPPVMGIHSYLADQGLEVYRAHMVNEVFKELLFALDYVIQSDQRWMYAFDIPPQQFPNPQFREGERWLADYEATHIGGKDWHQFYSKVGMIADSRYIGQLLENSDALLGFYCKRCDRHYEPDQVQFVALNWLAGQFGRSDIHPFCPEIHDLQWKHVPIGVTVARL